MNNLLLYLVIAVLAVTTITTTTQGKKNAVRATELVEQKDAEIVKFIERINASEADVLSMKDDLGVAKADLVLAEEKAKADRAFVKAHLLTYQNATARGSRAEAVLVAIGLNNLLQKPITDQNGVQYIRATDLKRYVDLIKVRIGKLTGTIGDMSL